MRKISVELSYPGRTLEEVRAMLADRAFRDAVCVHQGVADHAVTIHQRADGSMSVSTQRTYGAEFIPSFARSFVGPSVLTIQREEWSSPTAATFELVIPGKPGEVTGTLRLAQVGTGVTETIAGQVKVSIPLVGGKVEDLVAGLVQSAFEAEHSVGLTWGR